MAPSSGIVTQLGANGAGDQSSRLSILDQRPSSSDDLPNCDNRKTIDDLPPTSDDQTLNVSTTHARSEPRLRRCNRKEAVTFDELISSLEEPQLLYLEIMFEYEDEDIVVGGSSELDHIQQHRLKLIDAIGRCRSLKRLDVFGRWHIEEVRVLCQNLLLHPALEELCLFNSFIDEREGATLSQMLLEQNHNILKRCSISGRGRVSAVGTTASKPGLAFGGCRDITFDELISAVKELQLDMLHFGFDADDYHLVAAFREAQTEHRLQLIDVVSKCQSLKRLEVRGMWNIDEVEVLCHVLCVNIGRELHPEVFVSIRQSFGTRWNGGIACASYWSG